MRKTVDAVQSLADFLL